MDKWLISIIATIVSLAGIYLKSRLDKRQQADNRRREFRVAIQSISARFNGVDWMRFLKVYDASIPEVKDLCIKIVDDIRPSKRMDFNKYWNKYCGFKHSDLELPLPKTPAGIDEYQKANGRKRAEMTKVLKDTLNRITREAE